MPRPRSAQERIAALADDADVSVQDVLREVADFRLALETDLLIAAAAMDAEAPEIAGDVIDGERVELAQFHGRMLERLAYADDLAPRRARRGPTRVGALSRVLAVAAGLVAIVGLGRVVVPTSGHARSDQVSLAAADSQLVTLSRALGSTSPSAVTDVNAAAGQLHLTLQALIDEHAGDPGVAQKAAQLLQAEISLLKLHSPVGISGVLAQAQRLATRLRNAAPARIRATVGPLLDAATGSSPSPQPKSSAKAKSSPSPKPSTSPSPKSTPSSASSSQSSSASSSPDTVPPLP